MNFAQKLSGGVRKHLSNLNDMYDRRVKAAEDKARVRMEQAKTKTEREKAKLKLAREKIALKRELYEARIATNKAKSAMEKARKEAGDLTVGERIGGGLRAFGRGFYQGPKKRRKKVVRRKKR